MTGLEGVTIPLARLYSDFLSITKLYLTTLRVVNWISTTKLYFTKIIYLVKYNNVLQFYLTLV